MSALPRDQYAAATSVGAERPGGDRWAGSAPIRAADHDFNRVSPQLVEVMCECGNANCTGEIVLSLREYEVVRQHPTRFLIKEGHEVADAVRFMGYGTGYVVVAKFADGFSVRGLQ